MNITYRNWKAKKNGILGENFAIAFFDDIDFINGLIDAKLSGRLAEIKTCQEWQNNGRGRCRGRFVFSKEQHKKLLRNDGLYIFVVLMNDGSKKIKVVEARKVNFKRKICWTKFFEG